MYKVRFLLALGSLIVVTCLNSCNKNDDKELLLKDVIEGKWELYEVQPNTGTEVGNALIKSFYELAPDAIFAAKMEFSETDRFDLYNDADIAYLTGNYQVSGSDLKLNFKNEHDRDTTLIFTLQIDNADQLSLIEDLQTELTAFLRQNPQYAAYFMIYPDLLGILKNAKVTFIFQRQ
jgi:hypothetical protein